MAILFLGKAYTKGPQRSLWNGSYDYSWLSSNNTYTLDTPEKFAAFCKLFQEQKSELKNSVINLECDVEIYSSSKEKYKSWGIDNLPKSNDLEDNFMLQLDIPETSIFNGNNHTIKGIFTIAENIINLRNSSNVKDLYIEYSKCISNNATVIKPALYSTLVNIHVSHTDIIDTNTDEYHKTSFFISGNDKKAKGIFTCYRCYIENCSLVSENNIDLSSSAFIFASVGSSLIGRFSGLCVCNSEYSVDNILEVLRLPDDIDIKYIATYDNSNITTDNPLIVELDSVLKCENYISKV